jgi:GR25 family glycosyltransferase involved in LPS biosynthesis
MSLVSADNATGHVHFVVLTLNRSALRRAYVSDMQAILPDLEVVRSINGFDKRETVRALAASRLKYHINTYCSFTRFGTYGSLANFLSKVFVLHSQVRRRIPYQAILEDDMQLQPGFRQFVERHVRSHLRVQRDARTGGRRGADLLQLGNWGEGYVTSLASARRVLSQLATQGGTHPDPTGSLPASPHLQVCT